MKTQNFLNAINDLATMSSGVAAVNLAAAANSDGLTVDKMRQQFEQGINALMQDKDIILTGTRHNETALFSAFKKAIQRHNTQVLWSTFRPMFETDGLASAFLGHVRYSTKEGFTFENDTKDVKVSAYTRFDCAANAVLGLSAKKKDNRINVDIEQTSIPVDMLIGEYEAW